MRIREENIRQLHLIGGRVRIMVEKSCEKIDKRLRSVEGYAAELQGSLKVVKWIGGVLTALVISILGYYFTQLNQVHRIEDSLRIVAKDERSKIEKLGESIGTEIGRLPVGSVITYSGFLREKDVTGEDGERKEYLKRKAIRTRENLEEKGWFVCDGRKMPISEYKELHDVVGLTYGVWKDNENNVVGFKLPNYQGLFFRGVDSEGENDPESQKRLSHIGEQMLGGVVGSVQGSSTALPTGERPFGVEGLQAKYWKHTRVSHPKSEISGLVKDATGIDHVRTDQEKINCPVVGGVVKGGDKETRPKNVYVYWLIKVR